MYQEEETMNTETRVRFGLKNVVWFAPNAAIIVFYTSEANYIAGVALTAQLRGILPAEIAKRLVFGRG